VCVLDWVGDRNAGEAKREKKLLAALLCNWKECEQSRKGDRRRSSNKRDRSLVAFALLLFSERALRFLPRSIIKRQEEMTKAKINYELCARPVKTFPRLATPSSRPYLTIRCNFCAMRSAFLNFCVRYQRPRRVISFVLNTFQNNSFHLPLAAVYYVCCAI